MNIYHRYQALIFYRGFDAKWNFKRHKHEDTNAAFRYAVLKELNLTLTQA